VRLIFNTGPAPELDISRGATAIADGGTDTVTGLTAGTAGTLTYTLANTGAGSLTLTNPATLASQTNCTVSITTAPTTPVAAAGSTSTVLSVTPTAAGAFSFTYSIGNNDGNENPYNWTVSGTAAAAAAPELDVTRGATPIADGATDTVGAAFMAGTASALIYTFTNSGTASLTITNPATLGAQTNCTVTITTVPTTPVAAAGTTTTELSVTPTGAGAFSFTYSIANSDANENPYNWTVSGTATAPAPEMDLARGATAVADGSTDTATGGASGTALVLSYTITNSGSANLTLNIPVAAPGTLTNCTASITAQPTTPIAAAGTSVIVVSVTPTAAGVFSCTLTIGNNDANENPYDWTISGTATGPQPEMDVLRIAASVADGSNDTLGSVLFGQALTVTYTIANTGTAGLNLTGAPTLVVATAGANVTSATVTTQPAASVAIAASTSFVVTYNVTAAGAFSFTLSIANNDSNENPYNWTVDGTGTAMPEINVTRAATPVADGGTNAVGNVTAGQSQTLTYTIANQGNVALTITTPVTVAGLVNCTATVVTQPGTSVAAAGTTTLVISVTPTAVGAFSFTVSFANNDADENPYNWTVSGTGTALGGGVAGGGGGGGGGALTSSGTGGWLVVLASVVLAGFAVGRRRRV